MIEKIKDLYPEKDFLIADGFNDAIIGFEYKEKRIIYSVTKCLEILNKDMSKKDAEEYFDYNIAGAYLGDKTPIWCYDNF